MSAIDRMEKINGMPARYLGDGVYAVFDGSGVWLHANDAHNPTDRVYLEPSVFEALRLFVKDCNE